MNITPLLVMIGVGIIGVGTVGTYLVNQLQQVDGFEIIFVCNSRQILKEIKQSDWKCKLLQSNLNFDLDMILRLFSKSKEKFTSVVMIDCTSGLMIPEYYCTFMNNGIHIITPNKKGFSSNYQLYHRIKQTAKATKSLCGIESTVGAGIAVINTVKNLLEAKEEIIKIEGVLSGTLSYLFNEFSSIDGKLVNFSELIKEAMRLGFTEPDPRNDLDGMDVARKCVILARLLGMTIELEDIALESLIPAQNVETSLADFIEMLPAMDGAFSNLQREAFANNCVLRYTACIEKGKIDVGLKRYCLFVLTDRYPFHHPFAQMQGSDNIISIQTANLHFTLRGPGAGAASTVFGIISNLTELKRFI